MKKLILFESLLILFFVLAWNVSKSEQVNRIGFATQDCGWVVSKYESNDNNERTIYKDKIDTYIWGVLTGLFMGTDRIADNPPSAEALVLETINHCKNNAFDSFGKAIMITFAKMLN